MSSSGDPMSEHNMQDQHVLPVLRKRMETGDFEKLSQLLKNSQSNR
jgi:hypothetical protein